MLASRGRGWLFSYRCYSNFPAGHSSRRFWCRYLSRTGFNRRAGSFWARMGISTARRATEAAATRMNEEKRREEPSPFEVLLIAENPSPITTTGGMKVLPHYTFDSCPRVDIL